MYIVHGDDLQDLHEYLSAVESSEISMMKHGLCDELEGGTLFQCAKDRLHKNLLERFLTALFEILDNPITLNPLKDFYPKR